MCVYVHVYDGMVEWGDLNEKQKTTMMFESDDEWRERTWHRRRVVVGDDGWEEKEDR